MVEKRKTFWDVLKMLALSRKFWIALLAMVAALVMYVQGAITAEQLADALVQLAGLVIAAIAAEDAAAKFKATPTP
jgi:hypothetical protein